MADSITYIGGLPVLIDNARFQQNNGKYNTNITEDTDYFITGFFDSGDTSSKKYCYKQYSLPNTYASIRFFDDISSTSVDYWSTTYQSSINLGATFRTVTTYGRYIACSVKKSEAANTWCYCISTNSFIFKGECIDTKLTALIQNRYNILSEPKHIQVIWNQKCPEVNADNWRAYSTTWAEYSFADGVASGTIKTDNYVGYRLTARVTEDMEYAQQVVQGHKYYFSYEVKPDFNTTQDIYFSVEFAGGTLSQRKKVLPNVWTRISFLESGSKTGYGLCYIPNLQSWYGWSAGSVMHMKNPLYVDLTKMYGAGNEPDIETFEKQCAKNGVDLLQYQPFDVDGTQRWWII